MVTVLSASLTLPLLETQCGHGFVVILVPHVHIEFQYYYYQKSLLSRMCIAITLVVIRTKVQSNG